jgi:Flp pilus assembly protein TadD
MAAGERNSHGQRFAEAPVHLRRPVEMKPAEPRAWSDFGVALSRTGERAQAIPAFRPATDLSRSSTDLRLSLGMALPSQGERPAALEAWYRLRSVDPEAEARLAVFVGAGAVQ